MQNPERFIRLILPIVLLLAACRQAAALTDCDDAIPEDSAITADMLDPDTCALPVDHVLVNANKFPLPPTFDADILVSPESNPELALLTSNAINALDVADGKSDGKASGVVAPIVYVESVTNLPDALASTSMSRKAEWIRVKIAPSAKLAGNGLKHTMEHEKAHMVGDPTPRSLDTCFLDPNNNKLCFVGGGMKLAQDENLEFGIRNVSNGLSTSEGAATLSQIPGAVDLTAQKFVKQLSLIEIMSPAYKDSALVYWVIAQVANLDSNQMQHIIKSNNWDEFVRAATDSNRPMEELVDAQAQILDLLIRFPDELNRLNTKGKIDIILQRLNEIRASIPKSN